MSKTSRNRMNHDMQIIVGVLSTGCDEFGREHVCKTGLTGKEQEWKGVSNVQYTCPSN